MYAGHRGMDQALVSRKFSGARLEDDQGLLGIAWKDSLDGKGRQMPIEAARPEQLPNHTARHHRGHLQLKLHQVCGRKRARYY